MRFIAIKSFANYEGSFKAGTEGEAPDAVVREWIRQGKAKPAAKKRERAIRKPPLERAVEE